MKSIALSFLVAVGLTLGAANAFADVPASNAVLTAAQEASREADAHARRANELRAVARQEEQYAAQSMKIALDDEKLGFTYEAGVQRAKALRHQMAARIAMQGAAREDDLAAQYRAKAAQHLGAYQRVAVAMGGRTVTASPR